jgi:hypothetical protein
MSRILKVLYTSAREPRDSTLPSSFGAIEHVGEYLALCEKLSRVVKD